MSTPADRPLGRRTVLTAGGAASVAALAAACSSGEDSPPTSAAPGGSAADPTTAAGSADPSAADPSAADPSGSGSASGLAAVDDVPDGGCLVVEDVLLARDGDTVVGHSSVCTHQGCAVAPAEAEAHCPCHGSRFNALTGAVLQGPATAPLPEVAVTVEGDRVVRA